MLSTELIKPTAIQTPIAVNGNKNIPPQEATGADTSSIDLGFLPITSEPLDQGGQAPERTDFNGMFYLSTDQRVYLQNGGFITYDATVAAKIGGYPQGAILDYLDSNDDFCQVKSLVDNNQENFVLNPAKIDGVNWKIVSGKPSVISILKQIYPVGAIFIGTTSTCPMAALFGTWELVAEDRCLQGSSINHGANTTIAASLPNLTGNWGGNENSENPTATGVFGKYKGGNPPAQGDGTNYKISFNASNSNSIYSGTTLQPSAYVVNVWRRTA